MSQGNERSGPLEGMLVLDFTTAVSGPLCGQLLYDNGARVIKVERPEIGDAIRVIAPYIDGVGVDFCAFNGGKESLVANIKDSDDVALLKRIIEKADILVENFRPGVMDRCGLSYDDVKDLNPRLIYASISGYGQTGPMHQAPAYDEIIQGASGMMSVTGEPGGPSLIAGSVIADCVGGLVAFASIMTACFARANTGRGCHIDTSMLESLLTLMSETVAIYSATGVCPVKHGNDHPTITPFSSYATGGREIVIACASPGLWQRFCKALAKEEWLEKPEYAFPVAVHENRKMFRDDLEAILKTQDHAYWIDKLGTAGVPVSLVNTLEEATKMEQLHFREFFVKSAGYWFNGSPVRLSTFPRAKERPGAPELGAHSEPIRKEFAS